MLSVNNRRGWAFVLPKKKSRGAEKQNINSCRGLLFLLSSSMREEKWDYIIESKRTAFKLDLKSLWDYRYLTFLFFRRDFVANYKQTVLGPLWFVIQPVLTTVVFTLIFGKFAGFAPESIPAPIFFMSGVVAWNYFADVFSKTSNTFRQNANIFGKVFFPRLVVPFSIMFSGIVKFAVQFVILTLVFLYYYFNDEVQPNWTFMVMIVPNLIVLGLLAVALGNIFSALTAKYRDFNHLVAFGIQLMMYTTTVIYPLPKIMEWAKISENAGEISIQKIIVLSNPITPIMETFRIAFCDFGLEFMRWDLYGVSWLVTIALLLVSIVIFNKTEQNFMDTV